MEQNFETADVVRGDIENVVTATGKLAPREYVDVGAQVSGQLKKLHVDIGDSVKKGQLLAEIDVTLFMAKVDQQRAQLVYQESSLVEKEAQLDLAKINHERQTKLYEAHATSLENLQNAALELQSAQAQLKMLKAQIEQTKSSLRAEEANLEFTRIYAPMDGTVVSLSAKQGQTLNANQQAPTILQIADLGTMTVKAEVSEADVIRLREGMEVYFKTLGREKRWYSKLSKVEPTPVITNNVVLYNALFDVDNMKKELMTSMTAQVFFVQESAKDTLLIPMNCVEIQKGKTKETTGTVRVLDTADQVQTFEVKLGVSNRVMIEVLSGLKEGQKVIVNKKTGAKNGTGEKKNTMRPRMM
ncbi:MAG: efflux RND transporter periplasmic adaptor subunit [Thiovulaceae bacterium]|nr:efflux RND transporter periplasmic adaptor subunit [Sulfurimonadaceae bacterium]